MDLQQRGRQWQLFSNKVQWQDNSRDLQPFNPLAPHLLLYSSQDVGAVILNEAAGEDFLWVEECVCVAPSKWGCKLSGKCAVETVKGHLPHAGRGNHHALSGNNSPINQGGLWERKQAVTSPVFAALNREQIQQTYCSGKEFLVSGEWKIIALKTWTHNHTRSWLTDNDC